MRVELHHEAKKYLDRLNNPYKTAILKGLKGLEQEPQQGDIKSIVGKDDFRLRVGAFRVIFHKEIDFWQVERIKEEKNEYS